MEMNHILHQDFLNNNLPDKCAKLIIADPPYFQVKGKFDFIWKNIDEYLEDVEKWAKECKRILSDNGTLFWWGMDRKIAYSQIILDKHFELLSTLVWEKPSIASEWETRRTFPERGQERILMYANDWEHDAWRDTGWEKIKSRKDCFGSIKEYMRTERQKSGLSIKQLCDMTNTATSHYFSDSQYAFPTKAHYDILQSTGYFQKPYEELRLEYEELRLEYEEQRRCFNNYLKLTDVLRFSQDHKRSKAKHDTPKPFKLTTALMLTCSRENDLVVVPFAGSGTECIVAKKEGRNFIGYEINEKHQQNAMKRINETKRSTKLHPQW